MITVIKLLMVLEVASGGGHAGMNMDDISRR
jgi:hypothetical protein